MLLAAAAAGLGLGELAALFAQMYERARSDLPDEDPDRDFADRGLKLATTSGGAGVVHGDLTPECAELAGRVLDALGAPACNQPASACDVHHVTHKKHSGKTSAADCVLLCTFHHQVAIHRWGWTLVLNPEGTTTA